MQNLNNATSEQPLPIRHRSDPFKMLGGKASGLNRARDAGFDVPDFVAVSIGDVANMSPEDLGPQVERFLSARQISPDHKGFAVRSSMSIEDQLCGSAAGLGQTELNVIGRSELLAAFRRIAAGFQADVVQSYVSQMHGQGSLTEGSIVLQDMVTPTLSGILFTCDPLSGDPSRIHIDAVCGPCRRAVDGHATINAIVDRLTNATTVQGPAAKALTPHYITKLVNLGDRHDARIGLRHDIEFAFVGRSAPIVLQSRPVMTTPPRHI
ncbi:MAG: PEP/pyruvate-binding domain-containing protein [Aliishimia sp.]